MNQIINMVLRQVMRKLVNRGVNAGINAISGDRQKGRSNAAPNQNAKRARQALRVARRTSKF